MSNGAPSKGMDSKALLLELKTNRRTQIALVAFVGILTWLLWPDAPKRKSGPTRVGLSQPAGLDSRQMNALGNLPKLAKLDMAGELPNESKMHRDLFLFEGPPPPPLPPRPPQPPPPPPTEAELKAEAEKSARDAEFSTRPQYLRYIGFLETKTSGIIGAFFKGDEPFTFQIGHIEKATWKLVKLTDKMAEFQNTKYVDMKMALEARDYAGSGGANTQVTNDF